MLQFLTADASGAGTPSMMPTILMLVAMVAVFYFLLIRPENKRKKEAENMRNSLKVGDRITTIGGIVGTVVDLKSDNMVIEVGADRVRIEFAKWALSTNETASERAAEETKKKQAEKAKAKAAKKAEKNGDK